MSHVTKIDLEVLDLHALRAAVARLGGGLEFKQHQTTYRWFGKFVGDSKVPEGMDPATYGTCEHAIGLPDSGKDYQPYELGVVRIPGQKGYRLVYDNWCGGFGLEAIIGKGAAKLRQFYAREVTIRTMRRQGFFVREDTEEDGTMKVYCEKIRG